MAGPNWKLEDDCKTVTLTIPTNPPIALKFDLAAVDDVLKNLGDYRAGMKPEISPNFGLGQKSAAIPDPKWEVEPELLTGGSLLHIRDPRYGWLHYLIPKPEAQKLASFLQNQADAPFPGLAPGKAN